MMNVAYDAIVVGGGACGGWAVKQLTEGGMKVLLVEAGPILDPARDFPAPRRRTRSGRISHRLLAAMRGQWIQAQCPAFGEHNQRLHVNDRDHPYTTPLGRPFTWIRGRQLGGRLHLWGRMVLRMSDLDFKAAQRDAHGQDWPITYSDLVPYYDAVERFLGVYGGRDGLAQIPDCCSEGELPLTAREVEFKRRVEARWPERRVTSTRIARAPSQRTPGTVTAARATGRLTISANTVASRLALDGTAKRIRGVETIDAITGEQREVRAGTVVVCASTIETLRLLLMSACDAHPHGLGGNGGSLGRYVMDHSSVALTGVVASGQSERHAEASADDRGGAEGFYIPRYQNLETQTHDFVRGYGVQGAISRDTTSSWLRTFGEMLPRRENRVTLHPTRRDIHGLAIPNIDVRFGENDRKMIRSQQESLRELVEIAGITPRPRSLVFRLFQGFVVRAGAHVPGAAIHEVGGARMGTSPESSVLNADNQCWGVDNLYVTDGSCFVSSGCQNPTLTMMAITARACDRILRH